MNNRHINTPPPVIKAPVEQDDRAKLKVAFENYEKALNKEANLEEARLQLIDTIIEIFGENSRQLHE